MKKKLEKKLMTVADFEFDSEVYAYEGGGSGSGGDELSDAAMQYCGCFNANGSACGCEISYGAPPSC